MNESEIKFKQIKDLLERHQLDALLLQRVSSFAWATCGAASYVNTASDLGAARLLITPDQRYVITDNIEATRLEQEEHLVQAGWTFHISPWYKGLDPVPGLTKNLRLGSDAPYAGAVDLSADLARLRANLTEAEGERFRELGRLCAQALNRAVQTVRPGQTEHEIAGRLAQEAESLGVQAIVNLIATDERIFAFRHPLPTEKTLDRYAMLVLCGRRQGLVCSLTRLVHFGRLPEEIRGKTRAVAQVDAALIAATRPGQTLAQVFQAGITAYANAGYPEEWHLHHQGGPAGYEPREAVATPVSEEFVLAGQAFAWNPSVTGTKSEDTILVSEENNEIITGIAGWPMLSVEVAGQALQRPAVLEIL
jgi:antitoxin VapB